VRPNKHMRHCTSQKARPCPKSHDAHQWMPVDVYQLENHGFRWWCVRWVSYVGETDAPLDVHPRGRSILLRYMVSGLLQYMVSGMVVCAGLCWAVLERASKAWLGGADFAADPN
jgi:hypothetical protein